MKIPALLTLLLAAVLSALPVSQARADDVSFDVFYNSLGDQGDWYNTPDYGYVWQPSIAYQNDKWRPYADGYWAQTDDGWTWVSYENFGWATYHYGRWTRLVGTGWVWVPGYEWGPGWVSWRTNDDYVGWAPLPPKRESSGNGGGGGSSVTVDYNTVEPENGYDSSVDEQYDIGPDNYCFVETRHFGAPVLREVLLPPQRNIVIIENTINVTRISYRRGGPRVVVFNEGPDFDFISRHSDRPIQRLRIERRDDIGFLREGNRDRNPNTVREGVFQIAAPNINHRPMDFNQIKPIRVKEDIRAPKVEHGWRNTGADQQTVERVRQQFQTQAREHPTRPPGLPAANLTPPGDPRQRERDPRANVPNATPPADPRQRERDARTNVVPTPVATPAATAPLPRGNSDADKRARRDAAQREKDARANGGQPTPAAPGGTPAGRPTAPPRNVPGQPPTDEQRRGPKTPDVTHEPTAAPTAPKEVEPKRDPRNHKPVATPGDAPDVTRGPTAAPTAPKEVEPKRDPRNHKPAATPGDAPAATPRADAQREPRQKQPPVEPKATAPARPTEDNVRSPRQQERTPPARDTAPETERHPVRPQETQQHAQTPPPAPRQEAREPRPTAQTPPPAPRQQAPPPAPHPETKQPQPTGSNADEKKKHDPQQ